MAQSMHVRQAWAAHIRGLYWPLVYGLNVLVCVGQIVASEITNRYGDTIFGASSLSNAPGAGQGEGGEEEGGNAINYVERDHALARTGVVSSVGIAIGTVSLILTIGSFAAYKLLDYRRTGKNSRKDYDQRFVLVVVVSILNFILCGGSIGLAVGYVVTSDSVKRYTTVQSSSTPDYLIAAGVMAALSALMLLATMVVDIRKLIAHQQFIGEDERERMIVNPEAGDDDREKQARHRDHD